ncbi:MAG: TolC family protein, partial [Acidobacteriota bacterium]
MSPAKFAPILIFTFFGMASAQQGALQPAGLSLIEALRVTLGYHPQIQIGAAQVVINQGVLQQASGAFDTALQAGASQNFQKTPLSEFQSLVGAQSGFPGDTTDTNTTLANAGVSRLFRNGISVSPTWMLQRLRDTQTNLGGVNNSQMALQMTIPLLRNRGREAVTAQESAAKFNVDAGNGDLNEIIAELLANTAASYWAYAGALDSLEVARASEERGRVFVSNVQTLIDADRVPRSDIQQVEANLAQRAGDRILAEEQAVIARQRLALAMGLASNQIAELGRPSQDLPEKGDVAPDIAPELIRRYIGEALDRRPDVQAARQRIGASRAQVVAAKNRILPEVDVTVSSGYSSLRNGDTPLAFLISPFPDAHGFNLAAGITYNFSPANNAAKGVLLQTQGAERQAELQLLDVTRTIASSVVIALQG